MPISITFNGIIVANSNSTSSDIEFVNEKFRITTGNS